MCNADMGLPLKFGEIFYICLGITLRWRISAFKNVSV